MEIRVYGWKVKGRKGRSFPALTLLFANQHLIPFVRFPETLKLVLFCSPLPNSQVNCTTMSIKDIKLSIWSNIVVTQVVFNTAVLDFQYTYNNPQSNWLWILGVDYAVGEFAPYTPLGLSVTVEGSFLELCPASDYYGSQSSCEYIVSGYQPQPYYPECCPKGVTAFGTPARLQAIGSGSASAPAWKLTR